MAAMRAPRLGLRRTLWPVGACAAMIWAGSCSGRALVGGFACRRPRAALSRRPATRLAATVAGEEVLQRGRDIAVQKGLLPDAVEVEPSVSVKLSGEPSETTAAAILERLPESGCVVVLQGPGEDSTEKRGMLVDLKRGLKKVEVWPVPTFFRATAFLLLTFSEQMGQSMADVLKRPEMLAAGIEMIEEMRGDKSIGSLAADAEQMMGMSSDGAKIDENVPLAFEYGQGEVVGFINSALAELRKRDSEMVVILDGPEEILRYIRTPFRFTLS